MLVTLTIPVVSPQSGGGESLEISKGSRYPFSIPFPSYISGENVALPPSYAAINPGVSTEVSYHVQVDVVRKGVFRRREV